MILHALYDYYQRKSVDPDAHMAPPGFEWKEIPFILEIDAQGNLIQIEDTREGDGKKRRAHAYLIPQGAKKASGVVANLFWDNAEYVLGVDTKGKPERVVAQHQAFVARIESLPASALFDGGVQAVMRFMKRANLNVLSQYAVWKEIVETNPNLTFRLHGDLELVCQRPVVVEAIKSEGSVESKDGFCLVTGENDEIERLHTAIKGVCGAQTSGANIVSFNLDAFNSYGKAQGANAPVGKHAAFGYSTALNHLLRKDSTQRLQVGDSSTVFWADQPSELETGIVDIFGEPPKDDP
ncbi:MAG: type I-C CRISPR-associated protein Cas8c/Csd1, partial [Burkholderiales bacterium]